MKFVEDFGPLEIALLCEFDGRDYETKDSGKEREYEEIVENKERVELGNDVSFTRCFGDVASFDRKTAEDDGEEIIEKRGQGWGSNT